MRSGSRPERLHACLEGALSRGDMARSFEDVLQSMDASGGAATGPAR